MTGRHNSYPFRCGDTRLSAKVVHGGFPRRSYLQRQDYASSSLYGQNLRNLLEAIHDQKVYQINIMMSPCKKQKQLDENSSSCLVIRSQRD